MAREYIRQQEEKQHSPTDRAKDIEVLGSRMDDMERSVARLDEKMDESHRRLESMLKLLLAKGVPTPPKDDALPLAAQEDNNDVHPPHVDTALTTTPQTMPLPTSDTIEVAEDGDAEESDAEEGDAEEGDAVDADNEEDSEEVHQEEIPGEDGLEEVIGGVGQEKGLESPAVQPSAGKTAARETGTEVAVQKESKTTTEKTKVTDLEKPEQVN